MLVHRRKIGLDFLHVHSSDTEHHFPVRRRPCSSHLFCSRQVHGEIVELLCHNRFDMTTSPWARWHILLSELLERFSRLNSNQCMTPSTASWIIYLLFLHQTFLFFRGPGVLRYQTFAFVRELCTFKKTAAIIIMRISPTTQKYSSPSIVQEYSKIHTR